MDIKKILSQNKFLTILFVLSTIFFLFQHSTGLSWDFTVYTMNAKYMLGEGFYFEWYRAPFVPFLISVFSSLGWLIAEYAYILFVSILFLYSCIRLSKTLGINPKLFYALMLNPFLLIIAVSVGTELLSLALLQLLISSCLEKRGYGMGISAGLLSLVRYTNVIYLPLLLFSRRWKKILLSIVLIVLLFFPWLLYNMLLTGSPLTSIGNSYALNILSRSYVIMQFNILDILTATNYLFPLFIIGLWFRRRKLELKDWVMLSVFILALISYFTVPVKEPRYVFNMILPCAYFAVFALKTIKEKYIGMINFAALMVLMFSILFIPIYYVVLEERSAYDISTDDCMLASNAWVYFNYMDRPAEPLPLYDIELKNMIDKGYRIIIYKRIKDPDYVENLTFLKQFPVLRENGYILLGDESKCMPKYIVNKTYLQRRNESMYIKHNYSIETDPCKILFPAFC